MKTQLHRRVLLLFVLAILLHYPHSLLFAAEQSPGFTLTGNAELFSTPSGTIICKLLVDRDFFFNFTEEQDYHNAKFTKIGLDGWIKKSSVKIQGRDPEGTVSKNDNLRASPHKGNLAVVYKGAKVEIIETDKTLVKVHITGWIQETQTSLSQNQQSSQQDKEQKQQNKEQKKQELPISLSEEGRLLKEITDTLKDNSKKLVSLEEKFAKQAIEQEADKESILGKIIATTTANQSIISTALSRDTSIGLIIIVAIVLSMLFYSKKLSYLTHTVTSASQSFEESNNKGFEETKHLSEKIIDRTSNDSNKIITFLTNLYTPINESLSKLSKDTDSAISLLIEKVFHYLNSMKMETGISIEKINKTQIESFNSLGEKLATTLTDAQRTISLSIADLNEKVLGGLSAMQLHLTSQNAESYQAQLKLISDLRHDILASVESSLKNNISIVNNMFDEIAKTIETRMNGINEKVEERLSKGFENSNKIFLDVIDRLQKIDQAQQKISDLSNNVVSLQKTLDNKGSRGAFGEVQLEDLVRDVFPEKFVDFNYVMSNGKRPDCLIFLPQPTGNTAIDAKFPLENYLRMFDKDATDSDRKTANSNFKRDINKHINDIANKYIIPGETANGAVMFIPSEAVFAEIHAHHPDLVHEAQNKRVWITSPTTLMAVLMTAKAVLADAERNKLTNIIHEHLNALSVEFKRFTDRMDDLSKHISQANDDVGKIHTTAKKIAVRFTKIEKCEIDPSTSLLVSEGTI